VAFVSWGRCHDIKISVGALVGAFVSCCLVVGQARAVPLTNAGFETGDTTGWTTSGNVLVLGLCAQSFIGCAPNGGSFFALLDGGNASLIQTVPNLAAGAYSFGAYVSFATNNPVANFDQGQISLTVQIAGGSSATVGFDPNALNGQFTIPANNGFSLTPWFLLQGTLIFAGSPADLLLNINVQDFSTGGLSLVVDNAFINNTVPLPAALPLFATGLGALGLFGWRRKKKAAALAA